jgi:DamX protein
MSALASISPKYQTISKTALSGVNADISVTARIDYNLRFAKQAVLVVGHNSEQYSQLASQFLVSLSNSEQEDVSNHINVAFLPASTKLNDIQVRCRLVEQLFVNTLFDPEQSLAESVLRFAKQHKEAISIVIDHAQALSLQIQYELTQLVSLAKKNKLTINVVLFGLIDSVHLLAVNKSLFKSKLVVIDGNSGQVLALEEDKALLRKSAISMALWQKVSLTGAMLLITAVLIWVYLLIIEDVNQQAIDTKTSLMKLASSDNNSSAVVLSTPLVNINAEEMQKKQKIKLVDSSTTTGVILTDNRATNADVVHALLAEQTIKQVEKLPAKANDVLQALVVADMSNNTLPDKVLIKNEPAVNQLTEVPSQLTVLALSNSEYYLTEAMEHEQGYVIQIAGFTDVSLLTRLLEQFSAANLYSYQRLLDGESFTVVTSQVYHNKAEAKAAIALLPAQLTERTPWLKSISSVISEINTFTP